MDDDSNNVHGKKVCLGRWEKWNYNLNQFSFLKVLQVEWTRCPNAEQKWRWPLGLSSINVIRALAEKMLACSWCAWPSLSSEFIIMPLKMIKNRRIAHNPLNNFCVVSVKNCLQTQLCTCHFNIHLIPASLVIFHHLKKVFYIFFISI